MWHAAHAAFLTFAAAQAGEYTTIDCPGTISGTAAWSINATGQIVGSCSVNAVGLAFIREPDGTFHTFSPRPSSLTTSALDINDSGVVTGYYYGSDNNPHGFVFDGRTISKFEVPNAMETFPVAINASGTVTGFVYDPTGAEELPVTP